MTQLRPFVDGHIDTNLLFAHNALGDEAVVRAGLEEIAREVRQALAVTNQCRNVIDPFQRQLLEEGRRLAVLISADVRRLDKRSPVVIPRSRRCEYNMAVITNYEKMVASLRSVIKLAEWSCS